MTVATLILAALAAAPAPAAENLIVGGDFEQGASGWSQFWSRSGEGQAAIEPAADGSGNVLAVKHAGAEDWSFQQTSPIEVKPGEIYELSGRLRVEGAGTATLCAILYGVEKKVLRWSPGRPATARCSPTSG